MLFGFLTTPCIAFVRLQAFKEAQISHRAILVHQLYLRWADFLKILTSLFDAQEQTFKSWSGVKYAFFSWCTVYQVSFCIENISVTLKTRHTRSFNWLLNNVMLSTCWKLTTKRNDKEIQSTPSLTYAAILVPVWLFKSHWSTNVVWGESFHIVSHSRENGKSWKKKENSSSPFSYLCW